MNIESFFKPRPKSGAQGGNAQDFKQACSDRTKQPAASPAAYGKDTHPRSDKGAGQVCSTLLRPMQG